MSVCIVQRDSAYLHTYMYIYFTLHRIVNISFYIYIYIYIDLSISVSFSLLLSRTRYLSLCLSYAHAHSLFIVFTSNKVGKIRVQSGRRRGRLLPPFLLSEETKGLRGIVIGLKTMYRRRGGG